MTNSNALQAIIAGLDRDKFLNAVATKQPDTWFWENMRLTPYYIQKIEDHLGIWRREKKEKEAPKEVVVPESVPMVSVLPPPDAMEVYNGIAQRLVALMGIEILYERLGKIEEKLDRVLYWVDNNKFGKTAAAVMEDKLNKRGMRIVPEASVPSASSQP